MKYSSVVILITSLFTPVLEAARLASDTGFVNKDAEPSILLAFARDGIEAGTVERLRTTIRSGADFNAILTGLDIAMFALEELLHSLANCG